jgi:hypothetical protein
MGRVEKFRDRCEVFHVGTSCSRALYVWTTDQNWSHCHSDLKAAYWTALQVLRMLSRAGQAIRMGQYFETCPTLALESLISGRQAFAISFSQRRVSLLQLAHLSHLLGPTCPPEKFMCPEGRNRQYFATLPDWQCINGLQVWTALSIAQAHEYFGIRC